MKPEELQEWFEKVKDVLETSYISHSEPWRQSGFSGPEERWIALRKPVADCIDRSGSFLDIGCANGYLLECCLRWTREAGIAIEPFGLDVSDKLLDLARKRLPDHAANFYSGNAYHWIPPRKFDFVRAELDFVPAEYERRLVDHLLEHYLTPQGRLLVAHYGEDNPDAENCHFPECHPMVRVFDRLADLGLKPVGHRDGHDPVKGRKTRIAILSRESAPE